VIRCVLDASAVLAWLFGERGEEVVDEMLEHAAISTVNLAELLYRADEEGMATGTLQRDLEALGLQVAPFLDEDARLLVEVRRTARRQGARLSLADCCCIATGIRLGLPVVGAVRVWESLRLGGEVIPLR
jgi:PIN domain nuclease of toxin-antitoxin system